MTDAELRGHIERVLESGKVAIELLVELGHTELLHKRLDAKDAYIQGAVDEVTTMDNPPMWRPGDKVMDTKQR